MMKPLWLGSVMGCGFHFFQATALLAQSQTGTAALLDRQATFAIPASSPSLRIAGLEYTGAAAQALLVSVKGEAPYAEVVTTDASGELRARVVLNPPPRRVAGFGMRPDGGVAIAGSNGSVSAYGPLGTPENPAPMPNAVSDAQFINGNLTGLTHTGVVVLDQTGGVQSLVAPYKLTWPLALTAGPSAGEAAVIELGQPALNVVTLSTGSWKRVVLASPGLQESRTGDLVVPAAFSVTIGKDNGRIFAAVNPVDRGVLTVLEFDSSGVLRGRYVCPLTASAEGLNTYLAPAAIKTAGNTLLIYSARERQVAIYRLPSE